MARCLAHLPRWRWTARLLRKQRWRASWRGGPTPTRTFGNPGPLRAMSASYSSRKLKTTTPYRGPAVAEKKAAAGAGVMPLPRRARLAAVVVAVMLQDVEGVAAEGAVR